MTGVLSIGNSRFVPLRILRISAIPWFRCVCTSADADPSRLPSHAVEPRASLRHEFWTNNTRTNTQHFLVAVSTSSPKTLKTAGLQTGKATVERCDRAHLRRRGDLQDQPRPAGGRTSSQRIKQRQAITACVPRFVSSSNLEATRRTPEEYLEGSMGLLSQPATRSRRETHGESLII